MEAGMIYEPPLPQITPTVGDITPPTDPFLFGANKGHKNFLLKPVLNFHSKS
jgi:hypothetical protein